MFSQVSVRSHPRGVGTPIQPMGYPHPFNGDNHTCQWRRGVLIQLTRGVPHPADRGYPHPANGGTPIHQQRGTQARSGWGYPPPSGLQGVPLPPVRTGWGYLKTEQHCEYLLCGGRYTSCVHAGGLSCYW